MPDQHIGGRKIGEKAEIFKKIEPYLTFLNVPQLEKTRRGLTNKDRGITVKYKSIIERE